MSSFRRRLMMMQGGGSSVPGVKESEAGDICVYDVNKGSLAIIKATEWSASKYPISTYVPIGVVVVPASHGHYADGKCAIMSLNHMNCDTPQIGGYQQGMYWGVYGTDIDTLPNLDQVPYVGFNGNVGFDVIGQTDTAYLPSDDNNFMAVVNPYDNKTNYYYNDNDKYIPSPYNNDGAFNPNYSLITSPSSTSNCLADFDGYNNTNNIIEVRGYKDYYSWIPNAKTESDYPAASCCDMYFTQGTKQGDWYLPSAGELGYVLVRQQTINSSINKLINAGVKNAVTVQSYTYWCSSEYSDPYSRLIDFSSGRVSYENYKNEVSYVIAFHIV